MGIAAYFQARKRSNKFHMAIYGTQEIDLRYQSLFSADIIYMFDQLAHEQRGQKTYILQELT